MPPRFAYWTIILDGVPTSFRTKEREEILPLFNQMKAKNPGALLKWFSGGRLWDSPEQAREVRDVEKVRRFREERTKDAKEQRAGGEDPLAEFRRQHGRPADGSDQKPPAQQGPPGSSEPGPPRGERRDAPRPERRSKDWRPGGEHRDPRDKYKLPPGAARKRWKDRNLGPRGPKPFGPKPGGDRPYGDPSTRGENDRSFRADRPFGGKPQGPGGPRPFGKKPFGDRPYGDRPRGPKPFGSKPGGDRPFGDRPRGPKPFGSKPGGARPFSGRPRGPKPPGGPRRKG